MLERRPEILSVAWFSIDSKTGGSPEERTSRLRREEAEVAHQRRIDRMVRWFVLVTVAGALLTCVYVLVAKDPKTGLPDQAMSVITAVVAVGVGYVTGKASK